MALILGVQVLSLAQQSTVVINELNCRMVSAGGPPNDNAEFIELFAAPNTALDGYVLVFFNGFNGNTADGTSYAAYDLDGYSTDAQGFFVLGSTNVASADMNFTAAAANIQNGGDAIALYQANATDFPNGTMSTTTNLVDAMVYGTADATAALLITNLGLDVAVPGYTQLDETNQTTGTDLTLSRIPDGGAAFTHNYVLQALTPGTWNQPPCSAGTITLADGTSTLDVCSNLAGQTDFSAFAGTGNGLLVVSDANGIIVGTSSTSSYNFSGLVGSYSVHYLGYTNAILNNSTAAGAPLNGIVADQCASLSTSSVTVNINVCVGCVGGTVYGSNNGTTFNFISDANADVITLGNTSTSLNATYAYALTDASGNFIQWVTSAFDYNTLAQGAYQVVGISYQGNLSNVVVGAPFANVSASTCHEFSSNTISIQVIVIANVVINELNADNPGGPDTAEFIELYGDANALLDGLVMVFYDGQTGVSYAAHDLDTYSTNANGFFVMGDAGAANVSLVIPNAQLQNGADAIALYIGNATDFPNGTAPVTANLVDAMVYGTADPTATNLITGLGLDVLFPGYTQFDETFQQTGIDLTQSRVPDGPPALTNSTVVLQELTPGTYNIVILGCMDATACNYDATATVNDNTCIYPGSLCDDGDSLTMNDMYGADCVCAGTPIPQGCMDSLACNYDPIAMIDNGSCGYPGSTCDDLNPATINDVYDTLCTCVGTTIPYPGCMDVTACNYNVFANVDDQSCVYPGSACDDLDPNTVNDIYDANCNCAGVIGVAELEADNSWTVFPNPTKDNLFVAWTSTNSGTSYVRVFDTMGQLILQTNVSVVAGNNRFEIPTSTVSVGYYIVEITKDGVVSRKAFSKN